MPSAFCRCHSPRRRDVGHQYGMRHQAGEISVIGWPRDHTTTIPPRAASSSNALTLPRLSDEKTAVELRVSLSAAWPLRARDLVRAAGQVLVPFGLGEVSTCYPAGNGQPVRRVHVPE